MQTRNKAAVCLASWYPSAAWVHLRQPLHESFFSHSFPALNIYRYSKPSNTTAVYFFPVLVCFKHIHCFLLCPTFQCFPFFVFSLFCAIYYRDTSQLITRKVVCLCLLFFPPFLSKWTRPAKLTIWWLFTLSGGLRFLFFFAESNCMAVFHHSSCVFQLRKFNQIQLCFCARIPLELENHKTHVTVLFFSRFLIYIFFNISHH